MILIQPMDGSPPQLRTWVQKLSPLAAAGYRQGVSRTWRRPRSSHPRGLQCRVPGALCGR
jgi:hypothetical protein